MLSTPTGGGAISRFDGILGVKRVKNGISGKIGLNPVTNRHSLAESGRFD